MYKISLRFNVLGVTLFFICKYTYIHTGCFETRVQILNGSQNLTNESNGLIFVLNCRQSITFYNT